MSKFSRISHCAEETLLTRFLIKYVVKSTATYFVQPWVYLLIEAAVKVDVGPADLAGIYLLPEATIDIDKIGFICFRGCCRGRRTYSTSNSEIQLKNLIFDCQTKKNMYLFLTLKNSNIQ